MTSVLILDEIRAAESAALTQWPAGELMRRAGSAAASWISARFPGRSAWVMAGPGNNGGDAWVVAAQLHQSGHAVTVLAHAASEGLSPEAAAARQRCRDAGVPVIKEWRGFPEGAVIVDGLFGIGLNRSIEGDYAAWIEQANASASPIIALDIASGIQGDSGDATGPAINASDTLTFIAAKPGLFMSDGADHCGTVTVFNLGLSPSANGMLLDGAALLQNWPKRPRNTHKGLFGSVGILGGAPGMTGAALLAGSAALKSGAGRVWVALLDESAAALAPALLQPELMTASPDALLGKVGLTSLVVGPGLGQSAKAVDLLDRALGLRVPLVLDADALNLAAGEPDFTERIRKRPTPTLLTPHPGEARRLLPDGPPTRVRLANALAEHFNCPVVLKGCGSVLASPDGRWWVNTSGNAGLSSAGMGDVLAGTVGALLGQSLTPLQALQLGVYVHGAAADHWLARGVGPVGLTAREVTDGIRQLLNAR